MARNDFMREALKEAKKAFERDEVPVGAVIVRGDKVIARAHNQIKMLKDPTAHAEMIAITQAAGYLGNERLNNCDLYATIEPCPMCMGAAILARIRKVIFGAADPKSGACGSVINIGADKRFNHRIKVTGGALEDECASLMKSFFLNKRREKPIWTTLRAGVQREEI